MLTWFLAAFFVTFFLIPDTKAATDVLRVDPTSIQIDLAPVSWVLEDPEGKLTLAEVQLPANANRFRHKSPPTGFSTSAWWLRFTLVSDASQPVTWWFNSNSRTLQEIALFSPDEHGVYQLQSASANLPFVERPLPTTNFVFPLTLQANTKTDIYLRVRSTGFIGVNAAPQLWQPKAGQAMENKQKSQWVLYLGMVAALGLFNLMLAVFIRDSNYLLYTASVLGLAWAMSSSAGGVGSAYEYFWPDSPRFEQAAWLISMFAGAFFNIVFFLKIANFRANLPRIANFLQICLLIFGLIILIVFIGTFALPASAPLLKTLHVFAPVVLFTMYIGLALSLLWLASHGSRQAKFLSAAWLPMFFFISYWAMSVVREQPFNVTLAMWASAFELILMSLALADLFNQEKKAKEQAQATVVKLLQHSEHELEEKVAARTQELQQEQSRNKELLHNILPVDIATELSETGSAQPARHDPVTIIFTDFIDFTHAASLMPATQMVDELNEIFAAFDDICDLYGIEKIKTIGDAYMAVAGMPKPCADHAQRCVRAALRMVDYIEQRNTQTAFKWTLRIGIHSGPVVAGVVGKRKFAFDIWGDTVNVAARMESAGEDGRVNVSAYTCQLIQSEFECQYRGKLDVKSIGAVDMYFVTEIPRS